jgi:hypothetical protein
MAGEFRRMAENAPAYAAQQAADQAVSDAMLDPDQPRFGETRQYGGDLICNYDGSACRNAASANSTLGAEVVGGAVWAAGGAGYEVASLLGFEKLMRIWGVAQWLITGEPGTTPPGTQVPREPTGPRIERTIRPPGPGPDPKP